MLSGREAQLQYATHTALEDILPPDGYRGSDEADRWLTKAVQTGLRPNLPCPVRERARNIIIIRRSEAFVIL